jgi:peptide/nickel transport system substrate-binding protein
VALRNKWFLLGVLLALSVVLGACDSGAAQAPSTPVVVTSAPIVVTSAPIVVTSAPVIITPTPTSKTGGTLLLALGEDPDSLDPQATISATSNGVQSYIYDTLVYIGPDGKPGGLLAESWTISPDQKQITFKLRTGIKFHDGTPFNAQAVEYTFKRFMDPATASPAHNQLGPLSSVKAVDDTTVTFTYDKPFAPFFTNASIAYFAIISPTAAQKYGKDYGRNPVGTGPFMFKSWTPGSEIQLVRNPDYKNYRTYLENKGAPYLDGITLKVVPEVGTQIAALETGELHVITLQRESVPRFIGDPKFQVLSKKDATDFVFIEFNYKRPPFDDPKFRAAVGWAVDKQAIVDAAWGGYATPNMNPMPIGVTGYDDSIGKQLGMGYDPKKAAQMLDDLGWKINPATKIREKNGQPAKFACWTYSGFEVVKRGCEVIQANLNDVGMDVSVKLTDFGTMSADMPKAQFDFDLMRWTWPEPNILSLLFKTPGWEQLYSDKDVDAILDKVDTTVDPTQRLDYIKQAQQLILQKAVVVPILTDWFLTGARAEVQGLKLNYFGGIDYEDVWLKK